MRFDAAIFDLDGTLLNSMDVWERINLAFLKKRNLTAPENYVAQICARSFEEAAQYTIDLFGLSESIQDIVREWNEMADYEYAHNVDLVPNALEYLLRLKSQGIKLAVATGLPERLYRPCLENIGVLKLFDALCSADEVMRGKEFPDLFVLAAKRLQTVPEKCIVFDDVLPAVKSARKANMMVCGVYDKYSARYRTEITKIANLYICSFTEAPMPLKGGKDGWSFGIC